MGISFGQFVKGDERRTHALEKLAEIARKYPDLFTEVSRSWLDENGLLHPGNGEGRKPAAEKKTGDRRTLPNGFVEVKQTGYDKLEQALKEHNALTPKEAAEMLGYKESYMATAASNDARFLRQNGHLMLSGRPKGGLMAELAASLNSQALSSTE